jgi:hypothetical protein
LYPPRKIPKRSVGPPKSSIFLEKLFRYPDASSKSFVCGVAPFVPGIGRLRRSFLTCSARPEESATSSSLLPWVR